MKWCVSMLTTILAGLSLSCPVLAALPPTSDNRGQNLPLMFGLMGGALVLLIIVVAVTSKGKKKK